MAVIAMKIDWSQFPWGSYVEFTDDGVTVVADKDAKDAEPKIWICPRVDEPHKILDNQYHALCKGCGAVIVYRVTHRTPPATVPKVCTACAQKFYDAEVAKGRA